MKGERNRTQKGIPSKRTGDKGTPMFKGTHRWMLWECMGGVGAKVWIEFMIKKERGNTYVDAERTGTNGDWARELNGCKEEEGERGETTHPETHEETHGEGTGTGLENLLKVIARRD